MLKKEKSLFITFIFFPLIYLLGWLFITFLIKFFPFLQTNRSLYGTVITFCLFIYYLPKWSLIKWNKSLYKAIGSINLKKNRDLRFNMCFELLKSSIVILIISFTLIIFDLAEIKFFLNYFLFFNAFFLGIFVALAEELVFRVWLFEELNLFFSKKKSNIIQSIIFAFIHLRTDLNFVSNLQIFIGLYLLGLYLNNWRSQESPSILLPICFHGGLVTFWFFISNSFLVIDQNLPNLIFGPGEANNINPIGGLLGIFILVILNFYSQPKVLKSNV